MSAPSMMGSRICRDSTLACGTAPCPCRRSSALPFVTTALRYKRDNSSLCTEGRWRHLVHPRWLRKAVAQRSARLMTTLMGAIECVMDSNSKANREATQSCNPLLRFPEVWNATLHASELGSATGFRNRLYEGSDHTAEASTRRQSGALAGRCVLHPPHSTLLLPAAEPANSWNVGNPYPIALRQSSPSSTLNRWKATREQTLEAGHCYCSLEEFFRSQLCGKG